MHLQALPIAHAGGRSRPPGRSTPSLELTPSKLLSTQILARTAAISHERQRKIGTRQRKVEARFTHLRRFGAARLEELATRGNVEKQVSHLDRRSGRRADL